MTDGSPRIGIFDPDGTLAGSNCVTAYLARVLGRSSDTTVVHSDEPGSLARLSEFFDIDLSGVRERALPDYSPVPGRPSMRRVPLHLWRLLVGQRTVSAPYGLLISMVSNSLPPISRASRSVAYCHFPYASITPGPREEGVDPSGPSAHVRQLVYERLLSLRVSSYDLVLANSEYTAGWVRERWGRPAQVLPPPVVADPPRRDKETLVVSIGRFDRNDTKNHTATIDAFRRFHDRSSADWRLSIVGSLGDSEAERRYLASLRDRAAGYPVDLETNLSRDTLLERLARARLYWHSKGLGEDVPPAYREHFGMATVEAMRARCVPVVPDAGGQPEIVGHGKTGFLCNDVEEMVEASLRVAGDPDLASRIGARARERSLSYTGGAFERRLERILADRWPG